MKRFFVEKTAWDVPAIIAIDDSGDNLARISNGAVIGAVDFYENTDFHIEISEERFNAMKLWIQYAIDTEKELAELKAKGRYITDTAVFLLRTMAGHPSPEVKIEEPKPVDFGFRIVE